MERVSEITEEEDEEGAKNDPYADVGGDQSVPPTRSDQRTPKSSSLNNWQRTVKKMKTIVFGFRRNQDYRFDQPDDEDDTGDANVGSSNEQQSSSKQKATKTTKSGTQSSVVKRKQSVPEAKKSKEKGKGNSNEFKQLLRSKEALMTVIMEYVQRKLNDIANLYKKYAEQVKQWPDNIKNVGDAFGPDKEAYKAYMEVTATWADSVSPQLETYKKMNKSLKQIHMDRLTEHAAKFDEFLEVVKHWPEAGCFMTFPLEKNIFNKVFLFDHALTLKEDDLEKELKTDIYTHAAFDKMTPDAFFKNPDWSQKLDKSTQKDDDRGESTEDEEDDDDDDDDDDGEDDVKMATTALLQAILKGRDGFMPDALLNLRNLPKWNGKPYVEKSKLQMVKKVVRNLVRLVKWPLRAIRKMSTKLLNKAINAVKSADERKKMQQTLQEVQDDELIGKIYRSLERSKLNEQKIAEEAKKDMVKQGINPDEDIYSSAHDELTREASKNPFAYLQDVRYDLHIKPANELFDQLYPVQYEQLMEFYQNPIEFYKHKRLDSDTIYVARKFVEPNEHMRKLYKRPYFLMHEFFADPAEFYRRGNKLDKSMEKAFDKTVKDSRILSKLGHKLSSSQARKLESLLKSPNKYLGPTEELDAAVIDALTTALQDNKVPITNALINNNKLMPKKSKDKNTGDIKGKETEAQAHQFYTDLEAFFQNPTEFYKNKKLNMDVFQAFRDALEVSNDKDSNEELAQLNTEQYAQFLQFLEDPDEFLDNNATLDDDVMNALREVLEEKAAMFNLSNEQLLQLKKFFDKPKKGILDKSIFKQYRRTLPARTKDGKIQRIKDFFKGTRLRFAFQKLATEHQFDQLMRFVKGPKKFYQQPIEPVVLQEFKKILSGIVEEKRQHPMFNGLSLEQYNELMLLAKNPANIFAPQEVNGRFESARGVSSDAVLKLYTRNLKQNESCAKIKPLIELALYGSQDRQSTTVDLRGRLGAQIINSVLNTKVFGDDMWLALLMSLAGSGSIAAVLDLGLWHVIVHHVAMAIGYHHPVTIILMVILDSITPLLAETFDSFVIKRTLGMMQGKSFLPRTGKQFWADMKDASISGGIAALGSIPNNIVMSLCPGWKYIGLQAFTNQLAASTSAAMVPREIEKWHKQRSAAMYKLINMGFLPMPTANDLQSGTVNAKTVRGYCRLRAMEAMEIDWTTSIAFNSMGIGSVISFFFGFLAVFVPVTLGLIGEQIQRVVSIMFNTPTEILSLGAGLLTANHLGSQWGQKWLSTDYHKDKQMVQMIFEKGIEQLKDQQHQFRPIEFEDVYKIYHARFQLTYRFGKLVVNIMNGMTNGVTNMLKQRPLTIDQLDEQYIDKEVLVQNWKPNVVYLVQFPRTSSVPSLSPWAIKLETWLKMRNIPFYKISDGVLFRALFDEHVPFVEYNGQKIFGTTDEIIGTLEWLRAINTTSTTKDKLGSLLLKENEEEQMQKLIEDVLYSLILYDRLQNLNHPKDAKHLANDIGLRTQAMPNLLKEAKRNWYKIQPLSKKFWNEFFANSGNVPHGDKSWNGAGLNEKKWNDFVKDVRETHMPEAMKKFVGHLKAQIRNQLATRTYNTKYDKVVGQPKELLILQETMESIEQQLNKSIGSYLFGNTPTTLDASLFGMLVQLFDMNTIYTPEFRNYMQGVKARSPMNEYFEEMKAIFMGPNGAQQNWGALMQQPWPQNWEWQFNPSAEKYEGPFILRFDVLKLDNDARTRFTEEQRQTFSPLLNKENSESDGITGILFAERKFLAMYPKVVTFIVHELLSIVGTNRWVVEMAELPTIVELNSLKDTTQFVQNNLQQKLKDNIGAFRSSQNNKKDIALSRVLVHMMAAYLCVGKIDTKPCGEVHLDEAKTNIKIAFKYSKSQFLALFESIKMIVHGMMFSINDQYQIAESLNLFGAELLNDNEEQRIKHEAKRLRNAIWELERFGDGEIEHNRAQLQQINILSQEMPSDTDDDAGGASVASRYDALDKCEDQLILQRIKKVRLAIEQLRKGTKSSKFDPKEYLKKQKEKIEEEIASYEHRLSIWILKKFIVAEMRALLDELDNDKLSRDRIPFEDFVPANNRWRNLNLLVKKWKNADAMRQSVADHEWKLDSKQMKDGYRIITARKQKHLLKELWAKTVDQAEGVYSAKKYEEVLSYRLGQLRQLYEQRQSQLVPGEAVNKLKINEQYQHVKQALLQQLRESEVTLTLDDQNGVEVVEEEILANVTFSTKKQNIKQNANLLRKAITEMKDFVTEKLGELKKMSKKQLKENLNELNATVHRQFLLEEMLKLTNFLDEDKFLQTEYPFETFRDAYFSGELFILLRTLVEQDGTKFDDDDIRNGFNYVKDHQSMHRVHKARAFLFDRAGKVVKEKQFVKVLAWRMGQLSKLYILRKANIKLEADNVSARVDNVWEKRRQSMSEKMNSRWSTLKNAMAQKVQDIINAAGNRDSAVENEDEEDGSAMPLEMFDLQNDPSPVTRMATRKI
uniref:Uncharacterized protein n=1 Tax=Globodera rostochiensis TaxID=31243 RepID=A0A914I6A9_GLORO